jgi:hypoxanthine phosphoribosyltransferase
MAALRVLIPAAEIRARIDAMAEAISRDHAPGPICLVGVLKGSFMFLADLARAISIPTRIGFLGAKSYGDSTTSSGSLTVSHELDLNIEGQRVLIVEDIADTGLTISRITKHLAACGAHSIHVAALLDKPSRRTADITLDYIGFTIPDEFVIGYGLDFAEDYRNLPDICVPAR